MSGLRWVVIAVGLLASSLRALGGETLVTLRVPSLTCDLCRATVERALAPVPGVRAVRVDVEAKAVRVYLAREGEGRPGDAADRRAIDAILAALAAKDKPGTVEGVGEFAGLRGVPRDRLDRLARGVNLSHWLWLPREPSELYRRGFITRSDMDLIRSAGLTHVRLPFEPDAVFDPAAGALRAPGVSALREAIDLATGTGLGVVVDAHPARSAWIKESERGDFPELEAMWGALAGALKDTDPGLVYFEVMNEPHDLRKPGEWAGAQRAVQWAIRAAAPEHTVILTGAEWGGIDGLLKEDPGIDANVVYSFHFYESHTFTHQGATWGAPHWKGIRGLTYPASPEAVEPTASALASAGDTRGRDAVRHYGRERWDAEKVRGRIAAASAWGRRHGAPVYCGEFGVYRAFAPEAARAAWLRDTREAVEAAGIGWAMWDYCGGFALADGEPGARHLHAPTASALGLTPAGTP